MTAVFGAAVVAAGMVAAATSGLTTGAVSDLPVTPGTREWAGLAAGIALGALLAVLATGLGILTRSTAIAITALLLWRFVGEGLLPQMTGHPEIGRFTPLGATNALDGLPGLLPYGWRRSCSPATAA